jgi:hypothetical protein
MPNFTPEDLLLYHAGELEIEKMNLIAEELLVNWSLREKFIVLKEALTRLNSIQLSSPRKQTVQNIMRYAMRKPVTV